MGFHTPYDAVRANALFMARKFLVGDIESLSYMTLVELSGNWSTRGERDSRKKEFLGQKQKGKFVKSRSLAAN